MKLAIIGAGNMGAVMYKRLNDPENIWLCDPHLEKTTEAKLSCSDVSEIQDELDGVIFAIKPQTFEKWDTLLPSQLVISIMTGISIDRLKAKTGAKKVVRAMPNLALERGQSVTGWLASPEVSEKEKAFVHSLFSTFGYEMEVDREEKLNDLTAISGSGPAYFFYFCEHLITKAEAFGFTKEEASTIVLKTLEGAAHLLKEGEAKQLRTAVTSKGGTTEAALETLNQGKFPELFSKALDAAKEKAEELSR